MKENEEVIDERTSTIIPKGADEKIPQRDLMITKVDANTIGTLELTPEAEAILSDPLKDEDIKIRPDGFLYLQWTWYADRLGRAFGKVGWGMIPQGAPQTMPQGGNTILVAWSFWLIAKGVPLSFAIGETSYSTNNKAMSFTDAAAGAKSIALARCCKELGMASQLWDAVWIDEWRKKHAMLIDNPSPKGYPAKIWVLKNDPRYSSKPSKTSKPVVIASSTDRRGYMETEDNVDEDFPQKSDAKVYEINGKGYSAELMKELRTLTQLPNVEIVQALNGMEKGSYTAEQISIQIKEQGE